MTYPPDPQHPQDPQHRQGSEAPAAPAPGPVADAGPTSYVAHPSPDVLGDLLPGSVEPVRRRRTVLVAVAAAAAIGVAGVGVAAFSALSGGGTQPEDVLPAGAIAFVKVDFDPGAGQKLAAYRLAQRFPTADEELGDEASFRDDVLRSIVEDSDTGLDYTRDVQPWIGERAGVAVMPPAAEGEEPRVVVAIAHDDRDAAEAALTKVRAGEDGADLSWAFTEDYVLLGEDQALLTASASADRHLADVERFVGAVDALGGDQLALAWLDAGAVAELLPTLSTLPAATFGLTPDLEALDEVEGSLVMGLRVDSDAIELVSRTVDLRSGNDSLTESGVAEGTGLIRDLPRDSIAALSFGLDPSSLEQGYDAAVTQLEAVVPDLRSQIDALGLDLPADLTAVLGRELAAGAWGSLDSGPEVIVRSRNDDPARAQEVLDRLAESAGAADAGYDPRESVAVLPDGLAVGTPGALAQLRDGGLGNRADFRAAVPDADGAAFVLFVSIGDAMAAFRAEQTSDSAPLAAFGMTVRLEGRDGVARLRLTVRG